MALDVVPSEITQMRKRESTNRRSRRQILAQGGASAASGTLGHVRENKQARFSGRQKPIPLSPAKAGSQILLGTSPRAALRFTSFSFACPGLNSAVRFADLLSHSARGRACLRFSVLLLVSLFAACNRGSGGGISAVPGGFPTSATPAEISSSAQVVKVATSPVQLAASGSVNAVLRLSISPGYHINANPATFSYLIATEVTPKKVEGIEAGKPSYPAAKKQKFEFAEEPLAVYEGDTTISLSLRAGPNVQPGSRSLPVTVRVQACDNEKCYPPANVDVTIPIEVK